VASLAADMDSLDPLTGYDTNAWAVQRAITRQLVTFPGSTGELRDDTRLTPDLAESWEVSADGTTHTFHLRDGVTYSGASTRSTRTASRSTRSTGPPPSSRASR
jgi:peptide/nickel transport system substrate-binding protein